MDIKNRKVKVGDKIKILNIVPEEGNELNEQLKIFEGKVGIVTSILFGVISGTWGCIDLLSTDKFLILT
jgi:hypothetical protein